MTAMIHEQFSVPHGHKIITQCINKMINVNGRNMKAIVPAEQEAHTSQICKKTTLFLLSWLATSGVTDVQLWNNQVSHEMTVLSS